MVASFRWAVVVLAFFVVVSLWILGDVFFLLEQNVELKHPVHHAEHHSDVFPFLHISDLHINKFAFNNSALGLERFVEDFLPVISPAFVVVTGDLTDAKDANHYISKQHVEEWEKLESILKRANTTWGGTWIDIRGNHDAFDVGARNSHSGYFSSFFMHHFSCFESNRLFLTAFIERFEWAT